MLCLNLCRWIFFLMVGLCLRCVIVMRLSRYCDSLVSLGICDCMMIVEIVGLMLMVR